MGASVKNYVGKIAVGGVGHDPVVLAALGRVFGIASIEVAWSIPTNLDDIVEQAVTLATEQVGAAPGHASTFRIDARRTYKAFEHTSMDINRVAGAAVARATDLSVNLGRPDLTVWVEVDTPRTYVYCRRVRGAGGLPAGSSGRGVLLLSGGIDSPVAGWLAMRRGLAIHPVHFHSPPHTDRKSTRLNSSHYS